MQTNGAGEGVCCISELLLYSAATRITTAVETAPGANDGELW